MMRDRILHLADLHLGDPHDYLGDRARERRREADGVLDRIADHIALSRSRIGGVIIAGDLFEHHAPGSALVERVLGALRRIADHGVELLTVPGNHDEYSYPNCVYRTVRDRWPGTLVTNAHPARVATWRLGDRQVHLYAMAYVAGASRAPYERFEVEKGDAFRIAVFHGSLDLPTPDRSLPLSSRALEALGLDYVALGHLHTPTERRVGKTTFCYPGRIEGSGFLDPGGAPLLELEPTADGVVLHRSELPVRAIESHELGLSTLGSREDLDARIERLAEGRSAAVVRLTLRGVPGFALDPEALQARWSDRFHHLEVRVEGQAEAQLPHLETLRDEPTVRGRFVRIALERIERLENERERRVAEAALREGLAAFGSGGSGRSR
jgi:exonuclease SbcD